MAVILVIEDEPVLARNLRDALRFAGHEATAASNGEEGIKSTETASPDLILLDYRLPGMTGLDVLRQLRQAGSGAAVIMMTAHGNIDVAVEAMKSGADDFLIKPLDLKELELIVARVLNNRNLAANLNYFRNRERAETQGALMIGESPPMKAVKAFIERITASPALGTDRPPSILITGETGTGKDLVARAIHYSGSRHAAQFVQVNCTAMPDHLVESELFGHVKGAFTDARGDKRGLFEIADGGTAFLDEIGHMKPSLQAKLLNVLENRVIRPVGGTRERKVDVHFIAATNRKLEEALASGDFREDLYHRLRVLMVEMPPLRQRGDDILALARHFLNVYSARFGVTLNGFSEEAVELMMAYDWPGNVRELMHVVESAVLITDGRHIRPEHMNIRLPVRTEVPSLVVSAGQSSLSMDFAAEDCPKLDEIENRIIEAALEYSKHNLSRAARILGISRDAVRYRLERFNKRG